MRFATIGCLLLTLALCLVVQDRAPAAHVTTIYGAGPYVVFGNPSSGIYDANEPYVIAGGNGSTSLNPLAPGGQENPTANFLAVLTGAYTNGAGWSFVNSAAELTANSFEVRTYDAIGTPGFVGADFYIQYNPGAGDPTAATHDIHWIQVVTNNHNLTGAHYTPDNKVDVPAGQTNPYYDTVGAAGNTQFLDIPGRVDTTFNHTWSAEVFLATTPLGSGLGAQQVTLWSGATWGWTNVWVPEPSSIVLGVFGLVGLLGFAWRKRRVA